MKTAKSFAAVTAAFVLGTLCIAWTGTSKATTDGDVEKNVCEQVQKGLNACNTQLATCVDDKGKLEGNVRDMADYLENNCGVKVSKDGDGKVVIVKKTTPTPTVTAKPTATVPPPQPKPKIHCIDSDTWVFTAPQCTCGSGEHVVRDEGKKGYEYFCSGKGGVGPVGPVGPKGADAKCSVARDEAKHASVITCNDGTTSVVKDGASSVSTTTVKSCTTERDEDQHASIITCPDGTTSVVKDGTVTTTDGGSVWIPPPLVGLEFFATGWASLTKQGGMMGEGLGVELSGRLSKSSRLVGSMEAQWTSVAPDMGGMYFLWPQFGYRYSFFPNEVKGVKAGDGSVKPSDDESLRDSQRIEFKIGVRQGFFAEGEKPTYYGRRFTGNSAFAGAHATFSVTWGVRLSSWLTFGASGWLGYGWLLSNPVPCPPAGQTILPAYSGLGGGLDGRLTVTFF